MSDLRVSMQGCAQAWKLYYMCIYIYIYTYIYIYIYIYIYVYIYIYIHYIYIMNTLVQAWKPEVAAIPCAPLARAPAPLLHRWSE